MEIIHNTNEVLIKSDEMIHRTNVEILSSALSFYANKIKQEIAYYHLMCGDIDTFNFLPKYNPLTNDSGDTVGFECIVSNTVNVPNTKVKNSINKFEFIIALKYVMRQSNIPDEEFFNIYNESLHSYMEISVIDTYSADGTFILADFKEIPDRNANPDFLDNCEKISSIKINNVPLIIRGAICNLVSNDLGVSNDDIVTIANAIIRMAVNKVHPFNF